MVKRHVITAGIAAAALLVGGSGVATAATINGPLPQAPTTSNGPDVPGQPDLPEAGDTPDVPDQPGLPEPGDTPDPTFSVQPTP
ncbi:hypothetical protein [Mycolicibacterium obuense]|uniref:Uncharacterized protein n=1 Tax=Mycolicibacterium obuense TaxID=1807 RepID=A0A0J6W3D2_9MYCO|nr:hypothetical protein [Mycolicibacterium obuense]KMO76182.1 hypothetical protein MOBUDSM44075_02712 [Mycolicibacterium obuense]